MESQLSNLEFTDAHHGGDPLEDFDGLFDYIRSLETQREHEKSRELLSNLMDIAQGFDQSSLRASPGYSTAHRLMAENHVALGQITEACRWYREGMHLFPDAAELRFGYGSCLARLHQFDAARQALNLIRKPDFLSSGDGDRTGLSTYRKDVALAEMYLSWDQLAKAGLYFERALESCGDWIPAHLGMIELHLIQGKTVEAEKYLLALLDKHGENPELMLAAANLALITFSFDDADSLIFKLKGALLGDDRFEYLLFKLDFFKGDKESLAATPYRLSGQTIETEAARVWLMALRGERYEKDATRIPEALWRDECQTLDGAWKQIGPLE